MYGILLYVLSDVPITTRAVLIVGLFRSSSSESASSCGLSSFVGRVALFVGSVAFILIICGFGGLHFSFGVIINGVSVNGTILVHLL